MMDSIMLDMREFSINFVMYITSKSKIVKYYSISKSALQAQAAFAQQLIRSPKPVTGNIGPAHRLPNTNPTAPLHQLLLNNNNPATSLHHHHKSGNILLQPFSSFIVCARDLRYFTL